MADYSIKSKGREFRFEGELLAQQEARAELFDAASCQITGKTFSIQNGGYVCLIEFLLSDRPNDPIVIYEEVDLMEDVEKVFYVFEPIEIFEKKSNSVEDRERVAQNCKKLSHVYEKMVFALLDKFQSACDCRGANNKTKPVKNKSSVWNKLGIK